MKLYDFLTVVPEDETIKLVEWKGIERNDIGDYNRYCVPENFFDFDVVTVFGLEFGVTFVSIQEGGEMFE